jgi:hypothetical protein
MRLNWRAGQHSAAKGGTMHSKINLAFLALATLGCTVQVGEDIAAERAEMTWQGQLPNGARMFPGDKLFASHGTGLAGAGPTTTVLLQYFSGGYYFLQLLRPAPNRSVFCIYYSYPACKTPRKWDYF